MIVAHLLDRPMKALNLPTTVVNLAKALAVELLPFGIVWQVHQVVPTLVFEALAKPLHPPELLEIDYSPRLRNR